jgi:hypothetical protein
MFPFVAILCGLGLLALAAKKSTAIPATFPPGTTFLTLLAPQFGEAASQSAPIEQTVPVKLGTALVIYPPTNWNVPLSFEGFSPTSSGIPAAAELAAAPFNPGNFGVAFVAQFPGEVRVNLSAPTNAPGTANAYFAVDVTVSA